MRRFKEHNRGADFSIEIRQPHTQSNYNLDVSPSPRSRAEGMAEGEATGTFTRCEGEAAYTIHIQYTDCRYSLTMFQFMYCTDT